MKAYLPTSLRDFGERRRIFNLALKRQALCLCPFGAMCDDVTENRRRTRLADALKDFGERVQLSVFECRLDEKQMASLRARLARLIEPAEDSVRIYRLCSECSARLEILGVGPTTGDPDIFVL